MGIMSNLSKDELKNLDIIEQAKNLRIRTPFFKAFVLMGKFLESNDYDSQKIL